jgi:hypothetical protein
MNIEDKLQEQIIKAIKEVYKADVNPSEITLQKTKKEFKGHYTLITFPLLKISKKSPEQTAHEIGTYLSNKLPFISEFNVIKGFLNLSISSSMWIEELMKINNTPDFGFTPVTNKSPLYMVEYSSPNTNKPLHLGHVRNNLLGHSLSEILKANGVKVVKTNLVNDRGIHICKSMVAWKKWGNGETPQSSGKKGDHLVGDYYVLFEKNYKAEIEELMKQGLSKEEAEKKSPLMQEAREMLRRWEAGDPEVVALWEMMNQWVYEGFDETYKKLGITFDKVYYESQTYLVGKEMVLEGVKKGIFYQKDLQLKEIPWHIECFDNSNIQGTNAVAACVVFKKAKPAKKDYRHFIIKTVTGPDDYASMQEIIHRRYSRLLKEGSPLPQLIVIDGGKGQLNAAVESLQKIGLYGKIAIIGIAKRLEEIYFPNDPVPLYLDKNSETLKLIQQLRDEAHRFGITFHRNKRSKSQISSELDNIKGIGPQTKKKLLSHFKSIKRIKEASEEEIIDTIGMAKGKIIINHFKNNN